MVLLLSRSTLFPYTTLFRSSSTGFPRPRGTEVPADDAGMGRPTDRGAARRDRKSTRLNSSHVKISYAVFCLKKKISNYTLSNSDRLVGCSGDIRIMNTDKLR